MSADAGWKKVSEVLAAPPRLQAALWWMHRHEKFLIKDGAYGMERHRVNARSTPYKRARRAIDPNFKFIGSVRARLRGALKKGKCGSKTLELIGCSFQELQAHIESLFQPGMTWANHGMWHVDHTRPLASFDLDDADARLECCNFKNLQPLWAADNLRKNSMWNGAMVRAIPKVKETRLPN